MKMGRKEKKKKKKKKKLTPEVKQTAADLYQQGRNVKDIAEILNIPRTTISYVIKKFRERGSTENSQRPGRPCLIQDRDYRQLERLVKNDRRAPLGEITAKFNEFRNRWVSTRTVRRIETT